jgi:hypothetical protein
MSRSKAERINVKMGFPQFGGKENKKNVARGQQGREKGVYWSKAQSILLWFARAGFLSYISFFFRLIGL